MRWKMVATEHTDSDSCNPVDFWHRVEFCAKVPNWMIFDKRFISDQAVLNWYIVLRAANIVASLFAPARNLLHSVYIVLQSFCFCLPETA
jgi:hypothetical protein